MRKKTSLIILFTLLVFTSCNNYNQLLKSADYGYKYEGYWRDGKHHGKGTYSYSNGGKYVGDFVDDEYEGFGILYMENSTMEGQFKKGRLNGKGKITYSDGSYYNGEVSDNIANGLGEKVYVNGDRYVGMFLYGKFHGKGTLYFNNGNIYDDLFNKKSDF